MVETQRTTKKIVELIAIKLSFPINLKRATLISILFFIIITGVSILILGEFPGTIQVIYTAIVSMLAGANMDIAFGTKKGTVVASGGGSLLAGIFSAIVSYASCAGCLIPVFASVFGASTASSISHFSIEFKIPIMVGTIFFLSALTIWNLRRMKSSGCSTCHTKFAGSPDIKNLDMKKEAGGDMEEKQYTEEKNDTKEKNEEQNMSSDSAKVRVELLYWEECPNWRIALSTLKEVMEEIERESRGKIKFEVASIKVETDELAKELRFPGSPTVRVLGEDVWEKDEGGEIYGLTCRVYRVDGKMMPFLPKGVLKASVEKILSDKGILKG